MEVEMSLKRLALLLPQEPEIFNFDCFVETGCFALLHPTGPYPSEDWEYCDPHPAAGLVFRSLVDKIYEVFDVKNAKYEDEQPVSKDISESSGISNERSFQTSSD